MIQRKLEELKRRAEELDKKSAEFTKDCEDLAKKLTDRLSKRRRKYQISVDVCIMFDMSMYEFDVYINNRYYVTSYPIGFDEDLDEDQILKECDQVYEDVVKDEQERRKRQ